MAIKGLQEKLEQMESEKKSQRQFSNDLKKHNSKKMYDNLKTQSEDKAKAINFYDSLSESDKITFKNELRKKKIRDSYLNYLKYIYGDNFKLTKFHILLSSIAENVVRKIESGQKIYICISTPPQHGKGYPTNMPVLTTKGWKNHGDLQVGDYVYNDNGEQVMVIGTQKPYYHHCLRVNFSNGESHIITREHLWKVYLEKENRINGKHHNTREEHIIETQELMKILPKCRRSPYVLINKPLQNEEKELLINPYVLGLWLGDGCSANREIVVSDSDLAEELNAIGDKETYCVVKKKGNPNVSYIRLGKEKSQKDRSFKHDFTQKLHDMGVLNNKHIPVDYLLSSEEQRWELLRGLMDTDGCIDKRGNCEFCNTNKELAYNVYTLLHSLGIKARINEYNAKLYGRFISKKYRVSFTANSDDILFHISRKQYRVSNKTSKDREDKYKYFIKSIEEIDEQYVSCISVEGGMYLAGKELIPTHNSTCLTQTLPSWFLGRNPDLRCITTAYNSDIAEKFGDEPRQQIKKYGKELFGIEISDSQDNKTIWNIKDHLGGMYSTGINGALTSNQGALIIVDDPIKNEIEAQNPTIRENIWANFSTSLWTRQRGAGCGIIVIQTRWHEDDLIGRLKVSEIGEDWLFVNIPCVWESGVDKLLNRKIGQTLCPELGFDSKWADNTKKMLGARRWNALYQGKPFVESGEIVNRDMIKTYSRNTLPPTFEEIVLSCDLSFGAKKSEDPNGIGVWGRVGGNHYLLKVINKKLSFTEVLERIRYLCSQYPMMKKKIVESKASGSALIDTLNKEIGGFIGYDPKMLSKEDRLKLCLPYLESGNVFFPDESVDKDSETYIDQMVRFPRATHDEIVDITTQYLLNYEYKYSGHIQVDSQFASFSKAIRGFKI